jgi:hypothetical protein
MEPAEVELIKPPSLACTSTPMDDAAVDVPECVLVQDALPCSFPWASAIGGRDKLTLIAGGGGREARQVAASCTTSNCCTVQPKKTKRRLWEERGRGEGWWGVVATAAAEHKWD